MTETHIAPSRPHAVAAVAFQGMPGAYSHLACQERLPELQPLPCHSFEDAFAAVREGPGPLRHDPDRQLGRRAGRGRPPPPAARRPAHRRRDLPPGEPSSPGAQGRVARHPADRRIARPCHRPVPPLPARARAPGAGRGRHGGCRRRRGQERRHHPGGDRVPARGRDLRARDARRRHRGRGAQHDPLPPSGPGPGLAAAGLRRLRHDLRLRRPQRPGGPLQGAGRLRHQRRQHDEARELHRRQLHPGRVLRRRHGPSGRPQPRARLRGAFFLCRGCRGFWASTRPTRSASEPADPARDAEATPGVP